MLFGLSCFHAKHSWQKRLDHPGQSNNLCSTIADAPHCGEDVEFLAIEIHLVGKPLKLYNVYSKSGITQVCATAAQDLEIRRGDFSAHHPILAPCRAPDAAGHHIANMVETLSEIALLNSQEPMHVVSMRLSQVAIMLLLLASWMLAQP